MNGQAKDTEGDAIFREREGEKQREGTKGERGGELETLRQPNDREGLPHTLQLSRAPRHQLSPLRHTGGVCQVN